MTKHISRDLPVYQHVGDILTALKNAQVIIVEGETGSGKTTGLADLLYLNGGYTDVTITQPRITAATSVAEYVATLFNQEVGGLVGYESSQYKKTSAATKIVFRTDGLQLARETHGHGVADRDDAVIVIDEHHERSVNIDTLSAFLLKRLERGAKFKVIFSSATAEAERLQNWVHSVLGFRPPRVFIRGRTFPIHHEQRPSRQIFQSVRELLAEGRNVMVFLPGVRDILKFCERLHNSDINAEVLPLYADLSKEERDRAFASYDRPKVVVATNVGQTSITIPDIDAVVDGGEVKAPVIDDDGTPGLATKLASAADCKQRAGRAGRVKEGIAILCGPGKDRRPAFAQPEVFTGVLDGILLRLAVSGIRPEKLPWLDVPKATLVETARKRLTKLGALKKDGTITALGERMATYPVDPEHARMIVEAKNRDVVSDTLALVAVASVQGIVVRDKFSMPLMRDEYDNDLLVEKDQFIDVYQRYVLQVFADDRAGDRWLETNGVIPRRFHRALDTYRHLCEIEGIEPFTELRALDKRKDMAAAVAAGLWVWGIWYMSGKKAFYVNKPERLVSRDSVVCGYEGLVVGMPFNLYEDKEPLRLLQTVVPVSKKLLAEVIPGGLHSVTIPSRPAAVVDMPPRGGKGRRGNGHGGKNRSRRRA